MNYLWPMILLIFPSLLWGANAPLLGRSGEGLLMGDAYLTLADDASTLFYNPAAMGRHRGFSFQGLGPYFHGPKLFKINFSIENFDFDSGKDTVDDFPSDALGISQEIINTPIFVQGGLNPTIKMENFALTFLYNAVADMKVENTIRPHLFLYGREDRGIMAGYGHTFGRKRGPRTTTAVGLAVKRIFRQGVQVKMPLLSPELIDILDHIDGGFDGFKDRIGYSRGQGTGWDMGIEQNFYSGRGTRLSLGASILNIGDLKFKKREGVREIPSQKMAINMGVSWNQWFSFFNYALALDYVDLSNPYTSDFGKLKLGLRAYVPPFSFYLGMNGGYPSWGMAIKLFMVKVSLGVYRVEEGYRVREEGYGRFVLSINLFNMALTPGKKYYR